MVDERQLSSVLREFAFTIATDFSIESILDHLVGRIVSILPITSAGVTLIDSSRDPHYVAASDDSALRYEQLQSELGEGPCLLAFESGKPVEVDDLRDPAAEERFPRFAPEAVRAGLGAVFTFPLNHGEERLGALDLYRETPGALDPEASAAAQTLADVAAAYLLNARARQEADNSSDQLRRIATHDGLTGLPNRLLLLERLDHAAQRAQRSHAPLAVLFVDLDRFKRVNDSYGHEAGDQLLRAVAKRLTRLVRPGDTVARIYGDEFVLLCEDLHGQHDVDVLVDRVQRAFATPFETGGRVVSVSASVGVAYAADDDLVTAKLIEDADRAMYDAKRKGVFRALVDLSDAVPTAARDKQLTHDLRVALAEDDLHVFYQPIVRCVDGLVTGVEALLRWTHPEAGPVPALTVVGLAERGGLIVPMGGWVLEKACRDRVRWQREHPSVRLELAVNVSAYQLMAPQFVEGVGAILARTAMRAEDLVLEVTETVLIEDAERARLVILELGALGVRVALDDFGTGFSSLSYLRELPIDIVKIDQSFITNSDRTGKTSAIVTAVTDLAHALDLAVVIEGVETQSHRMAAIDVGADFAQGFLYARPMPPSAIEELMTSSMSKSHSLVLPPAGEDDLQTA
jgi:diguanylate cyclase (GGDEF)-like protein